MSPGRQRMLAHSEDCDYLDASPTMMYLSGVKPCNCHVAEIERLQAELDALLAPNPANGHGQPCYYCSEPCNAVAGNPEKWPIPLCHPEEPGKVKWHHVGCVSERLREVERLQAEKDQYLGELRYATEKQIPELEAANAELKKELEAVRTDQIAAKSCYDDECTERQMLEARVKELEAYKISLIFELETVRKAAEVERNGYHEDRLTWNRCEEVRMQRKLKPLEDRIQELEAERDPGAHLGAVRD